MPTEPSNATLNYWEEKNITASEVDWLGLDVKVGVTIGAFKFVYELGSRNYNVRYVYVRSRKYSARFLV